EAAVIVVPGISDDAQANARLAAARALLSELPRGNDGRIDASPGALVALKARQAREPALVELVERASTPAALHPPLERPTIEAWSMTSLQENTGRPEVDPWIRGWIEEDEPQTIVVWRKHLPVTDTGELFGRVELEAFREAADPHLAERLEADTWRVVEWLDRRLKTIGVARERGEGLDPEQWLRRSDVAAVVLDGPFPPRVLRADDLSGKGKRDVVRALSGALLLVDQ